MAGCFTAVKISFWHFHSELHTPVHRAGSANYGQIMVFDMSIFSPSIFLAAIADSSILQTYDI